MVAPVAGAPGAAASARDVAAGTAPAGRERAENLLRAAGKLAGWGPGPGVVLHPPAAGRFTRCAPGLSPVARRTLRANLRFTGRRVGPQLHPAGVPLPRGRAEQRCGPAQVDGYLAVADAQAGRGRRMRAAGSAGRGWAPPGCALPGWPRSRTCPGWPRSWQRPGSAAPGGPAT
ncbi:MAG TPA: hypothetical protein VFQ68_15035 [Streptosporangiaceae bacterium]|nr:hypothetical protein [Streptosporangiaceae bacterium]